MTRNRDVAHRNDYDCYCYHLLCTAAQELVRYTALGYDCFLFSETYGRDRQTVYYLAHKKLNKPTRTQRGASLGRAA